MCSLSLLYILTHQHIVSSQFFTHTLLKQQLEISEKSDYVVGADESKSDPEKISSFISNFPEEVENQEYNALRNKIMTLLTEISANTHKKQTLFKLIASEQAKAQSLKAHEYEPARVQLMTEQESLSQATATRDELVEKTKVS